MDSQSELIKKSFNIDEIDYKFIEDEALEGYSKSGEISNSKSSSEAKTEKNIIKVIFFQILASLCFSAMAVFCKLAYRGNPKINGFDYVLVRSSAMMILSFLQAKLYRVSIFDIKKGFKLKLYLFAIIGAIGVPSYFVGLQYVPTSIGSLIFSISPMMVAIIAPYVLGEVLTKAKVISIFGAFVGAAMFAFHKSSTKEESDFYYQSNFANLI